MENETSDFAVDSVKTILRRLRLEEDGSQWVGRIGDLVVGDDDDRVKLKTPAYCNNGGCRYPAPPGVHPVYAAAYDSGEPGAPHFLVNYLLLPFAPWEQVADAHWKWANDGVGAELEDCAFLCTDRSELAAFKRWYDSKSGTIPWMEEAVRSADVLARPGNYPDEIADPASGANILAFPVMEQAFAEGYTARNDAGDLLALVVGADEV